MILTYRANDKNQGLTSKEFEDFFAEVKRLFGPAPYAVSATVTMKGKIKSITAEVIASNNRNTSSLNLERPSS